MNSSTNLHGRGGCWSNYSEFMDLLFFVTMSAISSVNYTCWENINSWLDVAFTLNYE